MAKFQRDENEKSSVAKRVSTERTPEGGLVILMFPGFKAVSEDNEGGGGGKNESRNYVMSRGEILLEIFLSYHTISP